MSIVLVKDPDEVLDYTHDWNDATVGPVLASGETITTSTWSISPSGTLTQDSETETTTTATIWLSGGTVHEVYDVTNIVVTDNATPRTYHRTIVVRVEQR